MRKDQSANSVTKIKKGTMETERNPNEPIKPMATGQQGGQHGGGGQQGGGSQQEGNSRRFFVRLSPPEFGVFFHRR